MTDSATVAAAQPSSPSLVPNAAIQRCLDAWNAIYLPAIAKGFSDVTAARQSAHAYRAAMPTLTTPLNVSDFIACTAHGLLIGAIDEKRAAKLLYAAQVASGAYRQQAVQSAGAKLTTGDDAAAKQ